MHLYRDLYAMIFSKLGSFFPVRDHFLLPLPFQDVEIIRRPGCGDPVGEFGLVLIPRTTRKINNPRHPKLLSQQDRLSACLLAGLRKLLIGMQWVSMAT